MMGYLTRSITIYNLPATVISAFTASAVPAIAYAREKDGAALGESSLRVIKLIFLASFPCALGMMLFSEELFAFIYSSAAFSPLLALSGVMVIILPYVQTTTAMLQTMGKRWAPIFSTLGAIVLKYILNIVFVQKMGITGAPIATITAFAIAFVINTVMLTRVASPRGALKEVGKIFLCALLSCGGAWTVYKMIPSVTSFLICIMGAAAVYFVLVFLFRCITKSEILGKE